MTTQHAAQSETIQSLTQKLRRLERACGGRADDSASRLVSTGIVPLDELLPAKGFQRGTLIEWLAESPGSGAATLATIALRELLQDNGVLVVVDRRQTFYPLAAAALGIDLKNMVVVCPANDRDQMWALDQALRCRAVAAVWSPVGRIDSREFRRLQLAAETSGVVGLLIRPAAMRRWPTWSQVQLLVQPLPLHAANGRADKRAGATGILPVQNNNHWRDASGTRGAHFFSSRECRRLRVELVRCHGGVAGGAVELEIDELTLSVTAVNQAEPLSRTHDTYSLHLAAQLARPAARRRSARA